MAIEISSEDPHTISLLKKLAEDFPEDITIIAKKGHGAEDIISLIIENYPQIAYGTAAMIKALKTRSKYLKIKEDGLERRGHSKENILDVAD